jgi:PKD domain
VVPVRVRILALLATIACAPTSAHAIVTEVHMVDGPSGEVLDLGGVAMAEDGTGGLVYRKRVDGRAHVFAAQYVDGRWLPAQRVDAGQSFDSSWPRIGAGNGGRLAVTWVQEFGPGSDRMFSAALDPGARNFQRPVPIDLNVGEASATHPSLAMNRGGSAYLVYRVVTQSTNLPPGYVLSDTRIARYNGSLWTLSGSLVDRNPGAPTRAPTAANSPKVDIDAQGNGIVAFQEPDDDFVDRVWARRVFGSALGIPLLVSPQEYDGAPLRGPADGFDLDVAGLGQGAVAFRQQPGEGSRLAGPRVFVNLIPESSVEGADKFAGAKLADGQGGADVGVPSVSVTGFSPFLVGFGLGAATLVSAGDEITDAVPARLDSGLSTVPGEPRVELSDSTASVAAWREGVGSRGAVSVRELTADGVPEARPVRAPSGGPVNALELSGSGLGDGIVGFHQGGEGFGQVAAVVVDAPPVDVLVETKDDWVRRRRTRIRWAPALSSIGSVSYAIAVDDEEVARDIRGLAALLGPRALPDGRHRLEVVAIDSAGQETVSRPIRVRVDRRGPAVSLRPAGRDLRVRVRDAVSGLRSRTVRIRFGDGSSAGRAAGARHRYTRAGRYAVSVTARDRAGNRVRFRRRVTVR